MFAMLGCILWAFVGSLLYVILERKKVDPNLQKIYEELEKMKVEDIKQRLTRIESKVSKLK